MFWQYSALQNAKIIVLINFTYLWGHKPLVHYLKWSSFVFSVQIYSRMHADLSLAWN